jgi:hypothetical protein
MFKINFSCRTYIETEGGALLQDGCKFAGVQRYEKSFKSRVPFLCGESWF